MSAMILEVYDALKEAGASEEKAKKADEAVAAYDTRFGYPLKPGQSATSTG